MATENFCRRHAKELFVPSGVHNAATKSVKKDMKRGLQTTEVSKVTGVKEWYAWEVR